MAKVLELPVSQFFENNLDFEPPTKPDANNLLFGPYSMRMLRAFSKISDPEIRRTLLGVAESLAEKGL